MAQLSDALLQKISTVPEITPVNAGSLLTGLKAGQELRGGQLQNQVRESALFTEEQKQVVLGNKIEQTAEDKKLTEEYNQAQAELIKNTDFSKEGALNEFAINSLNIANTEERRKAVIDNITALSGDEDKRKKYEIELKTAQVNLAKAQKGDKTPKQLEAESFAKAAGKRRGEGSSPVKASDANSIRAFVSMKFKGDFDPLTGEFKVDSKDMGKALEISARAEDLFATGEYTHAGSVNTALQEAKESIGSDANPEALSDIAQKILDANPSADVNSAEFKALVNKYSTNAPN